MSVEVHGGYEGFADAFFPISSEVRDEVVGKFENDPDLRLVRDEIQFFDPTLWEVIESLQGGWMIPEEYRDDFLDGCSITYLTMKERAKDLGIRLPEVQDAYAPLYMNLLDLEMPQGEDFFARVIDRVEHAEGENFPDIIHDYLGDDEEGDPADDAFTPEERTILVYGSFALYDFYQKYFKLRDNLPHLAN